MTRKPRLATVPFLLLAALALPRAARAQTPDSAAASPAPPPKPAPDLWKVALNLAFTGASGNERYAMFTTGGEITRLQTDDFELSLDGRIRYGRSGGRDIARNLRGGIKFDLAPRGRWSPFLSATVEHDRLRDLDVRLQSGAGAKYTFWRGEGGGEASISLAGLYDCEDVRTEALKQMARWSWRVKGEKKLASGVRLRHTTLYQPVWDVPGDYLLSIVTAVDTPISQHIALSVSHDLERDATPPDSVRADDQVLNVGLKFEF
ncbi:MAG: DUF481 domain-containing protein [Gemmatimonadetes bacterium]|nr:DUF481 domain-containing protein [Gemmatimonadota bacterium]